MKPIVIHLFVCTTIIVMIVPCYYYYYSDAVIRLYQNNETHHSNTTSTVPSLLITERKQQLQLQQPSTVRNILLSSTQQKILKSHDNWNTTTIPFRDVQRQLRTIINYNTTAGSGTLQNDTVTTKQKMQKTQMILPLIFPIQCRFNINPNNTFYPCKHRPYTGVLLRIGEQYANNCIEKCFSIFHIQQIPSSYKCGSCYGRPTLSPRTQFPTIIPPMSTPTSSIPTTSPKTTSPVLPMPAPVPMPVPAPVPMTVPAPMLAPVPIPAPIPAPVPIPAPAPVPVPMPAPVPVPVTTPTNNFNITLDLNNITSSDIILFQNAAQRWNSIIVQELPNVPKNPRWPRPLDGCTYPNTINDIYICSTYTTIDGKGNIVGTAGPTISRSDNPQLPVLGRIKLDIVDVATMRSSGTLTSVILHEMGHVLGIGTLWKTKSLVTNSTTTSTSTCNYIGTNVNREYTTLSGCTTTIPLEVSGDTNTACSHFDDNCLQTELMTGYISSSNNPLSTITIGALHDIGYTAVDYTKSDTYNTQHMNKNCVCNRRRRLDIINSNTTGTVITGSSSTTKQQQQPIRNKKNNHHHEDVYWLQTNPETKITHSSTSTISTNEKLRITLSDSGRAIAMTYGKKVLQESKQQYDKAIQQYVCQSTSMTISNYKKCMTAAETTSTVSSSTTSIFQYDDKVTKYVAANVISVLYEENNHIFGVVVRS